MTPYDREVTRLHPDLPGLATLLSPSLIAQVTAGWGRYGLERLRLKPGASVTAMLRPLDPLTGPDGDLSGTDGGAGEARWGTGPRLLVRAFGSRSWDKSGKDTSPARRRGDHYVADPAQRLVVVPGADDRHIPGLRACEPDTGIAVELAERPGVLGRVDTLSHNPARRFVGLWREVGGAAAPAVLRLHRGGRRQVLDYVEGRPWRVGDPLPNLCEQLLRRQTDSTQPAERDQAAGRRRGATVDVTAALRAAATGLTAIGVAEDAVRRLAERVAAELPPHVAPAHGDLSPDQVVITGEGPVVLDWDRLGQWPVGWDAASWQVTTGAEIPSSADALAPDAHNSVHPAVLAAAAFVRAPEPFRRREPRWWERTEQLLALSADAVSAPAPIFVGSSA